MSDHADISYNIGNYNPLTSYLMKDIQLKGVGKEKNLGVIIISDLKSSS